MDEQEPKTEKQVVVEWHIPENVVTKYATNMVVQHSDQEFILSFFEILPPIILGTPQDLEKLETLSSVRAECIARVIVSAERMPRFVQVLQQNLEKAISKQEDKN